MRDAVERNPRNRVTVGTGVLLLATGMILNYLFERHSFFGARDDLGYPVLCFFLSLTGAAVLVGGLVRSRIKQLLYFAFPTVVSLAILYICFYFGMQFLQTGADRLGECPGLDQAAASTNVIPESLSRPGNPAVGCGVERRGMFLSYYNVVGIYGVTEAAAQQRVLASLTDYYRRAHTHPVRVMLYEKENWTVRQGRNGVTFGSGGPERLIRVVNIG